MSTILLESYQLSTFLKKVTAIVIDQMSHFGTGL